VMGALMRNLIQVAKPGGAASSAGQRTLRWKEDTEHVGAAWRTHTRFTYLESGIA